MKKKNLIWIIPVGLLVLSAIGFSTFKWQAAEARNGDNFKTQELLAIQNSLLSSYGQNIKINNIVEPDGVRSYLVVWSDDKADHVSLYVNGLEMSRRDIPKATPSPSPASDAAPEK